MTNPLGNANRGRQPLPTPPSGWPVGSYPTYAEAQRAVDYLADNEFPVQDMTIVGVDLMQVERVLYRLTWGKVIGGGIVSGAWLGLFLGLLLSLFATSGGALGPLLVGLLGGIVFGVITTSIPYAATKGQRDFASTMQLVAGRYDVLCDPKTAERARDMLARLAI
ncbi:general stress protein [Nocardia camponoti]|uniref:Membrane protein n=1 Tax=Nocardia camponoti TaxID=1616106 RepID=A0A917V6Y1_9NOCA|nr:general stress protein [Nocardia camponoti]GGK47403.1 membrane protein [Nocardia camponoti]